MNNILREGGFRGMFYLKQNDEILFKDEKQTRDKWIHSMDYKREIVDKIFNLVAERFLNSDVKNKRIKSAKQMRQCLYSAISKKTHLKKHEVQNKIKEYVKQHPHEVLSFAKEVSKKTGWGLENIKQKDLLDLIQQTSVDMFSSLLGLQPKMKDCHIANFVIAKICAEIFGVNIHLHDVEIHFDSDTHVVVCVEQLSLDAESSKTEASDLNLLQGVAIITSGMFSPNTHGTFFHIEPRELSPHIL